MNAIETPRRWYTADWLALVERMVTRNTTEPSASVEISRNAAGNAQISVKVYALAHADEADVKAATERAFNQATDAYDALCAQYPHVDPKAAKA